MDRLQTAINWISITSEISHFFCCGIPMVFSVLSLMSSLGLIVSMPAGIDYLHHMVHDYEIPMIIASGLILTLGWGLHYIARRIDCRESGCEREHAPCMPKKKTSSKILFIATGLFAFNVTAYFLLHA